MATDAKQGLKRIDTENLSSPPRGATNVDKDGAANSDSFAPAEDFTSFCRGELADALTEALFALYKGGPTKPSEALTYDFVFFDFSHVTIA